FRRNDSKERQSGMGFNFVLFVLHYVGRTALSILYCLSFLRRQESTRCFNTFFTLLVCSLWAF
ncbi:hypothetical protein KO494_08575, partial [Lacinutrix sp. C3R15]|uniref:hypothetical protein n=1 Tax=Flavobacteriaceae TaxID=49546 RepID=UPI001C0A4558